MLRHGHQAVREVGQALHHVSHWLLTLSVLLCLAVGGGAWRLSRGPVSLGYFRDRIEAAINKGAGPLNVSFDDVSIAWGGFSHGLDQPFVLRVTDLTIGETGTPMRARIPTAEATLSARWLLLGRVVPRTITLDDARLTLTRDEAGLVSFELNVGADEAGVTPLHDLLAALGAPSGTDMQEGGARLSQLTALSIRNARLRLDDRVLKTSWTADQADIDLSRQAQGGIDGRATLVMELAGQKARLASHFTLSPEARSAHVTVGLSQVTPKALADAAPWLAPLAALDVPLTVDGEADLGADLTQTHARITARAGSGTFHTDAGSIPIRFAELVIAGTREQATLEHAVVELQSKPDAAISTLIASGQLTHGGDRLGAALHLTLDRVDFADLPALWPADVGANARAWITANVRAGIAHDGVADLRLESDDTALDMNLIAATATLEGDDVAVSWLPSVPRIEQAKAHLVLTDPDKIDITVRNARQMVNGAEPIAVPNGRVSISGLATTSQVATVQCDTIGTIPSAIALLKEPRLRVLDRHPLDLRAPAGDARIAIRATVPLVRDLQIDSVTIHGNGTLSKAHLSGIVAGRDLDDGTLSLDADTNHLAVKGTAKLAGIAVSLDGLMDFRAGPPSQILQHFAATGRASTAALKDAGLDVADFVTGDVGMNVTLNERRNGDGELLVESDLTPADLNVSPLAWRKPAGTAAKASARVTLAKDRLTGIDRIALDGTGMQVRGVATATDGRLDAIRLDRLLLGRTDTRGVIRLPRDGPIAAELTGPVLDLAAKLEEKTPKHDRGAPEPPPGPAWSFLGHFDRVLLVGDQSATRVAASAESDGRVMRRLMITGDVGTGKPFSVRIDPETAKGGKTRHLAVAFPDAGELLRGLGVTRGIAGGSLSLTGDFDDTTPRHALSGELELSEFRVIRAPALGKLLQAVTLYGLVDALSGPGLRFSTLTAPFRYGDDTLTLWDVQAFSPSLGLTAKGDIDLADDSIALDGTVVPAYVFNSILGRIPFIGRLFSAEKGGGLFAMNYSLRGPIDDPTVSANPLSALTPGFLRGMFGVFDQPPAGRHGALDRTGPTGDVPPP